MSTKEVEKEKEQLLFDLFDEYHRLGTVGKTCVADGIQMIVYRALRAL